MLTVLIPTLNDEGLLGRVLAPLVPAAVTGMVREVIVADGGSSDATLEIADDAGCRILKGRGDADERLRAAAAKAGSDWLMLLRPSVQLLPGWEEPVRLHIETRAGQAAALTLLDPAAGWLARLFGRSRGPQVLIVGRKAFAEGGAAKASRRLSAVAMLIRDGR